MFGSKKRGRNETVVERRVTLPSKKVIKLTTAANRNVGAQYAQPAPQFVFNAPQAPNPMDIEQGERAAIMHGMGYAPYSTSVSPILNTTRYSPAAYRRIKRTAEATAKAAGSYVAALKKKASKASLKRARTSAKKGGSAIPKTTLRKAADKGTYIIHFRGLMKKSKNALIKAIRLEPKSVLAACLAKRYTK